MYQLLVTFIVKCIVHAIKNAEYAMKVSANKSINRK